VPGLTREPREVVLIKLGGSLLTDKTQPKTPRPETIERLAHEIAELRRTSELALLIGHGSGSFGHDEAARYRIASGLTDESQLVGVSRTQASAAQLNRLVADAFLAEGESPFVLSPSSLLLTRFGLARRFFLETTAAALDQGFLPLIYGDVVLDAGQGAAIASTEILFTALSQLLPRRRWRVTRVLWLGETDGIYGSDGETLSELTPTSIPRLLLQVSGASGIDVTGGVRLRLETASRLAKRGITSQILDGRVPGILGRALAGSQVGGTRVIPSPTQVTNAADRRKATNSRRSRARATPTA
jgi:isopentenyl phosphate kinase